MGADVVAGAELDEAQRPRDVGGGQPRERLLGPGGGTAPEPHLQSGRGSRELEPERPGKVEPARHLDRRARSAQDRVVETPSGATGTSTSSSAHARAVHTEPRQTAQ